eukprot:6213300-Pleurochrysis_carterae.AAC.1
MSIFTRSLTYPQHAPKCKRARPRADMRMKQMAPRSISHGQGNGRRRGGWAHLRGGSRKGLSGQRQPS